MTFQLYLRTLIPLLDYVTIFVGASYLIQQAILNKAIFYCIVCVYACMYIYIYIYIYIYTRTFIYYFIYNNTTNSNNNNNNNNNNERKNKQNRCILFEELLLLKWNILQFVLATVFQRSVAATHRNCFLVAVWSESQLRLWLVYSTVQ